MNSKGKAGKRRGPSGRRAGSGRAGPGATGSGRSVPLSSADRGARPHLTDVAAPLPHTPQLLGPPGPGPINSVAQFGAAGSCVWGGGAFP